MNDPLTTLARLMRVKPDVLSRLQQQMDKVSGQAGALESIVGQNDIIVAQTLSGLGLSPTETAQTVSAALMERLGGFDAHLFNLLGQPDLAQMSKVCGKLCETALNVFRPPKGLTIKRAWAVEKLEKYPPHNLLEHFGYANVAELIDKEGFASVMASLRFSQSTEWMHQFFDIAYDNLKSEDFEERDVELLVLDTKWLKVAEKFLKKKYHNVSHLKEFGIIFIVPIKLDMAGETLRMFALLLHYLHEVPFYAGLFRRWLEMPDFSATFRSLLRGDVPSEPAPTGGAVSWRVVQRYLAKDNADDFRLFEPHVNPEADHWWRAQEDLGRLSRILGNVPIDPQGKLDLGWWTGLDFSGAFFRDEAGGPDKLVSFDLIDLLMSLVHSDAGVYLYHQQEALWNKIFVEYIGRERMQELISEHIVDGFITL